MKRELHIFLYLLVYFSRSRLVEFHVERRQEGSLPLLGPRGIVGERIKKRRQPAFCLFGSLERRHLEACSKTTRRPARSHPLNSVTQLHQAEAVLKARFSKLLSPPRSCDKPAVLEQSHHLSQKLVGHWLGRDPWPRVRWWMKQRLSRLQPPTRRGGQDRKGENRPHPLLYSVITPIKYC